MRRLGLVVTVLAAGGLACGGSSTITVEGKLAPPPGNLALVIIQGKTAVPDAVTGAFSIAGVTPPYDLVAILAGPPKTGILYKGLRRADPTIESFFISGSTPHAATISGTVTGGLVPPVQLTQTHVTFGSPETSLDVKANVGLAITYTLAPQWGGAAVTTGTLHALQWNEMGPGDTSPAIYTGYGEKTGVTLSDGGAFGGQDIVMAPVASTSHLTGSVTLPAGYPNVEMSGGLSYADGAFVSLFDLTGPAGAFDYLIPSIPGATASLVARASLPNTGSTLAFRLRLSGGASDVALAVPAAPEAVAPDDAATGVTTATVFSWKPFTKGVHVLTLGGAAPQPAFVVVTMDASATIPDLTAQGVALPKGAAYSWQVEALAPLASLDEAADANSLLTSIETFAGDAFQLGVSQQRSFTTAP